MLVPIAALALLAAGNPDPAALLECWAKAVGGRDRLAKVQAVEREGTLATPGDKGTFHSWTRADGASHEQGTFGPSTWTTAFDGRRRWVLDGAAPVYDSAGVELQQAITEAYVASFSMLVPGRMPGEVRAGPGPSSLVLAPAGGREWAVALDPKTCLPRTFTYPGGDRTITVTLQKWAAFGGVLMPVASEQSDGDPETLMRIRVERTRVDAPFPDSLLARPEWKASVKIPA
ncbi:MAG TPA: hypothetical protein VND93_29790, partial [Myxococcales bacterium]|nr:hypothetical protein [Myxococcales bacterium]